jgi:uncharacterized HAD superfamily protein/adenine/guanine phosphoribosyltransferase-like PRPP-binding protein
MLDKIFEDTQPCCCKGAGFCSRHNIEKNSRQWVDCLNSKGTRFKLDMRVLRARSQSSTFMTVNNLVASTLSLCPKITDVKFIVGVPRSGMIPASVLATFLHSDLYSFDQKAMTLSHTGAGFRLKNHERGNTIYVVDDSAGSGATMVSAKRLIQMSYPEATIKTVAIVTTALASMYVDIYAKCMDHHFFEWSMFNAHAFCVFDMDGILCRDFTREEDDDGELYIKTMEAMEPTSIQPRKNPLIVVTSRLEKYRKQTEKWFEKNGYILEGLHMLDVPSKKDRTHAISVKHKSDTYASLKNAKFFVESDEQQASDIFAMTGKAVICPIAEKVFNGFYQSPIGQ